MLTAAAILAGFALDMLLGDPRRLPHPVVLMGKIIAVAEKGLRRILPASPGAMKAGGALLAVGLCVLVLGGCAATLYLCGLVNPWLRFAVEVLMCWQALAAKELWRQSMLVMHQFNEQGLAAAQVALGAIVGRDTAALDMPGVARATVETVAENASDGVIAPLIFLAVGGAPLGMMYKAINTMDSMIGYKNETYYHFGWFAARLDDVANYLPARLAGLFLVGAAALTKLSPRRAWRIMKRDARKHTSPNAGFAEAAVAGALGVQLGGSATYKGVLVEKPLLGDEVRTIQLADIARANRLMLVASVGVLVLCVGLRIAFVLLVGGGFNA